MSSIAKLGKAITILPDLGIKTEVVNENNKAVSVNPEDLIPEFTILN